MIIYFLNQISHLVAYTSIDLKVTTSIPKKIT